MDDDELRECYGDEYPNAVTHDGVRMPLLRVDRFARHYYSVEASTGAVVSRFADGTATMTFEQFKSEWPTWSPSERAQFCNECRWLHEQDDFPDMLRVIMAEGDEHNWSSIALSVASILPQEESYLILAECLAKVEGQSSANISQGIAATKHPSAQGTLRANLERLWNNPKLWDDDAIINWIGYDATCCIKHLLELGQPAVEFEEKVQRLSKHPCLGNRKSCSQFLKEYYPWLGAGEG
jgi:hypothetical protein